MKTQITNVEESKTYAIYVDLLNLGFNAKLYSSFSYEYEKDNNYLSISVRDCDDSLTELFDTAPDFELIVSKFSNEIDVNIEVRRHRDYAEFISEEVWMDYHNTTV